jgi:hypothetical protein
MMGGIRSERCTDKARYTRAASSESAAEDVYRDDLGMSGQIQRCTQHPVNVWALHGIVECLRRRGETEEHARLSKKLDDALAKADVLITSSCMCRATVYAPINFGRDCCS